MFSRTNSGDGGPGDHFDHPVGTGEEEGTGKGEAEGNRNGMSLEIWAAAILRAILWEGPELAL
jgi:hypothetical protein